MSLLPVAERNHPSPRPQSASVLVYALASAILAPLAMPVARVEAQEVGPDIGSQAPSAVLEDLDGKSVEILDYVKGKPALIEFWASWCEQCKALQPQLDRIHASYGDRVSMVAVAVAVAQTQRRVQRVVAEEQPGYPYLWDAKGSAVRAYSALTTSVIVILDAQGRVAYTGVGPEQDLEGAVARVVGAASATGEAKPSR